MYLVTDHAIFIVKIDNAKKKFCVNIRSKEYLEYSAIFVL